MAWTIVTGHQCPPEPATTKFDEGDVIECETCHMRKVLVFGAHKMIWVSAKD